MNTAAVCICTFNPVFPVLERVIISIGEQTISPTEVVLIDNGSFPGISESILEPLKRRGIASRLVIEPTIGLSHARLRAIRETSTDWIVFVDDDNEISIDYIACGLEFIRENPGIGCFGGRLLLPPSISPPSWVIPYLPWLGIKDEGDQLVINHTSSAWGVWEPPGGGSWVCRKVLSEYVRRTCEDGRGLNLGRQGAAGLASCDDSLLMRGAYRVGLGSAYVPGLVLYHHIAMRRFQLGYLLRLLFAYGESHALLESLLSGLLTPRRPNSGVKFACKTVLRFLTATKAHGWRYGIGQAAYLLGDRRFRVSAFRAASERSISKSNGRPA